MNKLWKYIQYGYLVAAAILFIEGIISLSTNDPKKYLYFGFAIFITLIFFLKRHFRRKIEKRNSGT